MALGLADGRPSVWSWKVRCLASMLFDHEEAEHLKYIYKPRARDAACVRTYIPQV
jgi:hypothetical protein